MKKIHIVNCPGCGNPTIKYPSTEYCGKCINEYTYVNDWKKNKAKCRNKRLDPDSQVGMGYITDVLVSKFLGINTCFDITDNFHYPKYDLIEHEDFGKINNKGSGLHSIKGCYYWMFATKKNKYPDIFFCVGYNENGTDIEVVYIIPNDFNITEINGIYVNKNWTNEEDPYYWFKQDEKEIKKWNDLFHSLKLENCLVLKERKVC